MKLQITPFKQDVKLKTRYAKNLTVPVAKVVFTTHVLFPTTQKQNKMIMKDLRNLLSWEAGAKDAVKSADFGFRLIVYHQLIISASSKSS